MKSFRPKDGNGEPPAEGRNGERDFHGEKRSNETHASTTDPDVRLYKKAERQASKVCRVGVHPGRGERLRERVRGCRLAVAGKGEAALGTSGIDHVARNHPEMPVLLSMPATSR